MSSGAKTSDDTEAVKTVVKLSLALEDTVQEKFPTQLTQEREYRKRSVELLENAVRVWSKDTDLKTNYDLYKKLVAVDPRENCRSKPVPALAAAYAQLQSGEITEDHYDKIVDKLHKAWQKEDAEKNKTARQFMHDFWRQIGGNEKDYDEPNAAWRQIYIKVFLYHDDVVNEINTELFEKLDIKTKWAELCSNEKLKKWKSWFQKRIHMLFILIRLHQGQMCPYQQQLGKLMDKYKEFNIEDASNFGDELVRIFEDDDIGMADEIDRLRKETGMSLSSTIKASMRGKKMKFDKGKRVPRKQRKKIKLFAEIAGQKVIRKTLDTLLPSDDEDDSDEEEEEEGEVDRAEAEAEADAALEAFESKLDKVADKMEKLFTKHHKQTEAEGDDEDEDEDEEEEEEEEEGSGGGGGGEEEA